MLIVNNRDEAYQTVLSYDINTKKALDKLFVDGFGRLEQCIDRLNLLKNGATSLFVKGLSEVNTSTHVSIMEALTGASCICEMIINEDGLPYIRRGLRQYLTEDMNSFTEYKKSALFPSLYALNIAEPEDTAPQMLRYAEGRLGGVNFEWTYSVIPKIKNLTNCNVIEIVTYAIDHSINDCAKRMKEALTDVRKNWFWQLENDAKKVKAQLRNLQIAHTSVMSHVKNEP